MAIRHILMAVWEERTRPAEALEEIRDEIRKGKKRVAEINSSLLYLLEGVRERLITINEAEEEIKWILARPPRKNKKGGTFIIPILPA